MERSNVFDKWKQFLVPVDVIDRYGFENFFASPSWADKEEAEARAEKMVDDVETLTGVERSAVTQVILRGRSQSVAAEVLGLSRQALHNNLQRGIKKLRLRYGN
jgi:DNA-directed RNA polymerase specialized sigma24 family protein